MLINLTFSGGTSEEILAAMASFVANKNFAVASAIPLDTAQHTTQSETASPAEAEDDTTSLDPPAKKGRGRPPKAKTETTASPPGEVVEEKAPAGEAADTLPTGQDIADVISALTDKFKNGDAGTRAQIRVWRDGIGLVKMGDLKAEHVEDARNFLSTLEG